jgi:hypothetical protein
MTYRANSGTPLYWGLRGTSGSLEERQQVSKLTAIGSPTVVSDKQSKEAYVGFSKMCQRWRPGR